MSATNSEFHFTLSVSTGQYPTKKPVEKVWAIQFITQSLTAGELEVLEKSGKAFCYNFNELSDSGLITQHERTLSNFAYTNVLFFDIDKMPISMEDYISNLPYKPTVAYTTYSNGIEKEYYKYGYRLIYVFQEPVRSISEFDSLYYSIAAANNFQSRVHPDGTKYEFDYRKVNQQYFGGGVNSETYRTDIIYQSSEFSQYTEAGMALMNTISPTKAKKQSKKQSKSTNENNKGENREDNTYYSDLDCSPFFKDLFTLSPKEFLSVHEHEYHRQYVESLSTPLILSEDCKYFLYPEDYQEVKRNWGVKDGKRCVSKWMDGSGRRKRLYVTAQIMKHNVVGISREQLIYNLMFERFYYYDNSDKSLTNTILIQIADNALKNDFTLNPCKHPRFSINKEYWCSLNYNSNQAKNVIRKELKEAEVLSLYDFNLSVMENLKVMKENGVKVSRSYLFNLKKKYSSDSPTENNMGEEEESKTYYSDLDFTCNLAFDVDVNAQFRYAGW